MLDLMTPTKRLNQYQTSFPFNSPDSPHNPKIQGIWAELLVIEQSHQPEILINAWHSSLSSPYDFTLGRDKIAVKYTDKEQRIHAFALDQLRPSIPARILVASTIVRASDIVSGGLSIKDLYGKIMERVTANDARLRLYTHIAQSVGSDLYNYENVFYDYASAVDYLEFYDAADIPCIDPVSVPADVSDITFTSNLSRLVDIRRGGSRLDVNSSVLFRGLI
ncbi:MAG: PD-(D/E)XK motif protein [Bacteroidia bacterium]|nr:PD-(D/E)XK motif protein [Bacteroidia bacterium]